MAELDCRIVGIFALALSLLSLGGVIFVRHHNHYNPSTEIHTSEALILDHDCPPCGCNDELESDDFPYQPENRTAAFGGNDNHFRIDEACLQCICEAATDCKPSKCSGGEECGLFRISFPYWIDAGKPTLEGAKELLDEDTDAAVRKAYLLCVNNPFCAARAVSGYIGKYARDCDGEDDIDCYDYAALHVQGPTGCKMDEMPGMAAVRFYRCWEQLPDTDT